MKKYRLTQSAQRFIQRPQKMYLWWSSFFLPGVLCVKMPFMVGAITKTAEYLPHRHNPKVRGAEIGRR